MKKLLLFIAVFGLSAYSSIAQISTKVMQFNQKDIGIPITKTHFEKKVSNYLKLMSEWTEFKTNEYIEMIRLYNTIGGDFPIKSDFYKMYYEVFLVMYMKKAAKSLEATPSKGMAMYSKKYDLWLDDVPLGNNNSRFKVDTLY